MMVISGISYNGKIFQESTENLSQFNLSEPSVNFQISNQPTIFAVTRSQKQNPVFITHKDGCEYNYQKSNAINSKNGEFSCTVKCANRESQNLVACGGSALVTWRDEDRIQISFYLITSSDSLNHIWDNIFPYLIETITLKFNNKYSVLNFEIRFIDLVIQEEIEKIKNGSIVKGWLRHLDSSWLSEFGFIKKLL